MRLYSQKWESLLSLMRIQVLLLPDTNHACEQANYRDLDTIVLQYLILHGHEEAAENLADDAALSMPQDRHAMQARAYIRDALLHGDVDRAMRRITEINPEVCLLWQAKGRVFSCTTLSFAMRSQNLITIFRLIAMPLYDEQLTRRF